MGIFVEKLKTCETTSDLARWYVRHAERYIKAFPEQRLATHTPQILEQYLQEKGRNSRLKGWQYRQLVTALTEESLPSQACVLAARTTRLRNNAAGRHTEVALLGLNGVYYAWKSAGQSLRALLARRVEESPGSAGQGAR